MFLLWPEDLFDYEVAEVENMYDPSVRRYNWDLIGENMSQHNQECFGVCYSDLPLLLSLRVLGVTFSMSLREDWEGLGRNPCWV